MDPSTSDPDLKDETVQKGEELEPPKPDPKPNNEPAQKGEESSKLDDPNLAKLDKEDDKPDDFSLVWSDNEGNVGRVACKSEPDLSRSMGDEEEDVGRRARYSESDVSRFMRDGEEDIDQVARQSGKDGQHPPTKPSFCQYDLFPRLTFPITARYPVLKVLDQVLRGTETKKDPSIAHFQAVALYGASGVGKTSIAQRYIKLKWDNGNYGAIFWLACENTASLRQSFVDIAFKLGLKGAGPATLHEESLTLVRNWLQSTKLRWLLVYDNVESAEILKPYWPDWPDTSRGKAIITTRNRFWWDYRATSGIEVTAWEPEAGSQFLLRQNLRSADVQVEEKSAMELSKKLGGLPMSISHVGGLINHKSCSILNFLRLHATYPVKEGQTEWQALLDFSFSQLSKDSRTFLGIASFLVSEFIPRLLFEVPKTNTYPEDLKFCNWNRKVADAIKQLQALALVKRCHPDNDFVAYSCHRLVQLQFRFSLPPFERLAAFENAVTLVYHHHARMPFADMRNPNNLHTRWNRCLKQVLHLKDHFRDLVHLFNDLKLPLNQTRQWCELLVHCLKYLSTINARKDVEDVYDAIFTAVEWVGDEQLRAEFMDLAREHRLNPTQNPAGDQS